jgi:DNA-binding GntR family transcriptional regulator
MELRHSLAIDLSKCEYQAPDSQTEIAYHQLEEKIVLLEFSPGLIVTEKDFSESIGFGRTPVREAIQRLAMAGLLNVLPRRGIKVSDLDACSVLRLLEVNRGLDDLVARSSAVRATNEQRLEFSRLAEEFDDIAERNDVVAQVRLDSDFNNLCMLAMGNEHANKMCRLLQPIMRRFWLRIQGWLVIPASYQECMAKQRGRLRRAMRIRRRKHLHELLIRIGVLFSP